MASKVCDDKSSNTYYQSVDHLGSTNLLTDAEGNFYEHIETFPDGNIWVKEYVDQSGVNATYTNYEMDVETKLFYDWARYYDAQLGRFLSTDPAMQHTNLYMYCRNNPLSYIDPTGMVDCRTNEDAQNRKYYGDLSHNVTYQDTQFIYNYNEDFWDKAYQFFEEPSISEEVDYINDIDENTRAFVSNAAYDEVIEIVQDPNTSMIVFSGHGANRKIKDSSGKVTRMEGGIPLADGYSYFRPDSLKDIKVSPNLKTVIFENCSQGNPDNLKAWQKAFGDGVEIVAWEGTTYVWETISFNNSGLLSRKPFNLKNVIDKVYSNALKRNKK